MDDYEEYLRKKEGVSRGIDKLLVNMKPIHVFLFAFMIFLANSIVTKNPENKSLYLIVGGVFAIFIFSMMKGNSEKKEIPRNVAQRIAMDDLRKEVGSNGSYPLGTKIIPTSYFRDQTWDSGDGVPRLFKYHFGFLVQKPSHGPENIIYEMNPFNARCKSIKKTDIQFEGQEINDIKMIPFTEIISKKADSNQNK